MKVEKREPTFYPMAITLENQAEVDVLHALVALAGGIYADRFTYKLYEALDKYSTSNPSEYWIGILSAKDGPKR